MANTAIVNGIQAFFKEQNWKYDYFEEEGMFQSAVGLTEETGVMIHAIVGEAAFTVMVAADLAMDSAHYDEFRALINDVNARLLLGTLVLDVDEGILYFRIGQNCVGQTPSAEIIEDSFMYPISFMDENYETFKALFAGQIDADRALTEMFEQNA